MDMRGKGFCTWAWRFRERPTQDWEQGSVKTEKWLKPMSLVLNWTYGVSRAFSIILKAVLVILNSGCASETPSGFYKNPDLASILDLKTWNFLGCLVGVWFFRSSIPACISSLLCLQMSLLHLYRSELYLSLLTRGFWPLYWMVLDGASACPNVPCF